MAAPTRLPKWPALTPNWPALDPELAGPHPAAELTSAHPPEMTTSERAPSTSASTTRKRVRRNAGASNCHDGNDDRDFAQHAFFSRV